MKKNLLTVGALVLSMASMSAQVMSYVGDGALFYVSKKTLVYNGGGMKMQGAGVVENHGNVMVVGGATDVFQTVNADGSVKTNGGNFHNRIDDYNPAQAFNEAAGQEGINYTYGQLYISGLTQGNITGIVNEEYQRESHGDYQEIGIPFYDKEIISGLSSDFEVDFNAQRWSEKEVLVWNNRKVRFDNVAATDKTTNIGHNYYAIGAEGTGLKGFVENTKKDIIGRPLAEDSTPDVMLKDAGVEYNFGQGGNARNYYNEKYNTYLQDGFHLASGGQAWDGNYGKNLYQFSNPYLTNIDLANIAREETGSVTDGVNISNIYGIRLEPSGVTFNTTNGSESTAYKYIMFEANGTPVGDVAYGMVRPMATFVIKMRDNNGATLSFKKLRRFNYKSRLEGVDYSVTAARNANFTNSTVKQLGVIGLDANGKEVARTYYVVTPSASTGYIADNTLQSVQYANPGGAKLGSFEEDVNGGYDTNVWSDYWLYINEANENDFQGKNIKVVSYDSAIKSFKFEIRENAELVENGTHALSQGVGFYYKGSDGEVKEAKQGEIISLSNYAQDGTLEYDFYYGTPESAILGIDETKAPSRTQVVYNPSVENYVVLFDANWKKADIKVFDLSGKLVLSESNIDTSNNYEIKLQENLKSGYVVDIISDNGQKLTKKILK